MRIRGRHYANGRLVDLECEHGLIRSITDSSTAPADLEAGWIAPALFDLQINGCDGISFNSPKLTIDDVRHVVGVCRRHGIGFLCPTLITNSFASLRHGVNPTRIWAALSSAFIWRGLIFRRTTVRAARTRSNTFVRRIGTSSSAGKKRRAVVFVSSRWRRKQPERYRSSNDW
jgi:hypothetical protein